MKKIIHFVISFLVLILVASCGPNEDTKVEITVNGGTGTGSYKIGEIVTCNALINEGETFIAWLYNGSVVSTENPYSFKAKENAILEADVSGRVEELIEYTITYHLDGGSADNPTTYNKKTRTFSLNNPTKDGYVFTGWTYAGVSEPVKKVTINRGSVGDLEFFAHYEEYVRPDGFTPLRVGIFADVQLTTSNQGSTANAYISLVNHFKYCKEQNVDVIFMNGDIVNNAVESYYQLYEKALKSVYGTDESKYPEFVWNMGNHEWWDTKEANTANAVALFNKYARIDSKNLVAKSKVRYSLDGTVTLPTYYKVINGVPFLAISGALSDGSIPQDLANEIATWLEDIQKLEYVRAGGAIFVAYHYALPSTYFGQGQGSKSTTIMELFKDIPNAIVFTGDTHFPGSNERTINQVNFTSINIGTSSYSRNVNHSATSIVSKYYNMANTNGGKSMDIMDGEAQYLYEYTETIMIADFTEDGTTLINRYFLDKDPSNIRHVGLEWELPLITSKDQFIYTDERFENKEWANILYGKDGLEFSKDAKASFNKVGNEIIVYFDEVTDFNYCEHYIIELMLDNDPNKVTKYDIVSSYYKWDKNAHTYHIILKEIEEVTNYQIKITGYDYFDNPSLNNLVANEIDENTYFGEKVDLDMVNTYTDISRVINYETKMDGSATSVEYFYQGLNAYSFGATLGRVILPGSASCMDALTLVDYNNAVLEFYIKNDSNVELIFGLTVVVKDANGKEVWLTDCGKEYQKVVDKNADWTHLAWNLTDLFGITSKDKIVNLSIKGMAKANYVDSENGYSIHFYMDKLDIVDGSTVEELDSAINVQAESLLYLTKEKTDILTQNIESISFKLKITTPGNMFISFFSSTWDSAFTYLKIVNEGQFVTNINGITVELLEDGFTKITIDASLFECSQVAFLQFRSVWTTAIAQMKDIEVKMKIGG